MKPRMKFTVIALSFVLAGGLVGHASEARAATDIDSPVVQGNTAAYGQSALSRALAFDSDQAVLGGREGIQLVQRPGRGYRRAPRARDRGAMRDRRDRRRGIRGRDVGIGIGAAILGGIIASEAARADRQAMIACDERFRSFDWETGTYVTYGGEVRVCPYLR